MTYQEDRSDIDKLQSELEAVIVAKLQDAAFVKLAGELPQLNEIRYLPVIRCGMCSVSDWYVLLPSGKKIILSNEDWRAASPLSSHHQGADNG